MPKNSKAADPAIGHNSINRDRLKSFVDRIEALEIEMAGLSEDRKSVYLEAKGCGLDGPRRRRSPPGHQDEAAGPDQAGGHAEHRGELFGGSGDAPRHASRGLRDGQRWRRATGSRYKRDSNSALHLTVLNRPPSHVRIC
jgi:Uncharacterized protein conserved in bacteria (DUF2312)